MSKTEEKISLAPFDWVIDNKLKKAGVVLSCNDFGDLTVNVSNRYLCMRTEDKISPLPLTKEILEKNGWELHDDVFINKDENISNIIFSTSGKFILGGVFVIEYVHQLQQYLRLDGDIDFANNLKV